MKKFNLTLLVLMCLFFISCKKQGCMDEYAVNYDVNAKKENNKFCVYNTPEMEEYIPLYGPASATLVVIDEGKEQYSSPYGTVSTWSYAMGAKFSENGHDLVNAGDVAMSVYSQEPVTYPDDYIIAFRTLEKYADNSYLLYHENLANTQPNYFPSPIEWKGSGNTWPAFNLFISPSFSNKSTVLSGHPSTSSSYNFEVSPMTNSDSLVLEIIGQRKHITKVIPSHLSAHVFSQQEINSIGKGEAILRVISVKYDKQEESGITYYFLNQKRSTKEVYVKP